MNEKYQLHYNKILTGTLTDTIMKSISYQANIQLANEIIADQEKTIQELQKASEETKKELESVKVLTVVKLPVQQEFDVRGTNVWVRKQFCKKAVIV